MKKGAGPVSVRAKKKLRQDRLTALLEERPFMTDADLAQRFQVSVQTIRLDRMELGIPELRRRAQAMAEVAYAQVRSVRGAEIVGQLLEVKLGEFGRSMLHATDEMGFARTRIVRGHHLFAQVNSLAVAIMDAAVALTGKTRLHFLRPVMVGESVIAEARVTRSKKGSALVQVASRVGSEEVLRGQLMVVSWQEEGRWVGMERR